MQIIIALLKHFNFHDPLADLLHPSEDLHVDLLCLGTNPGIFLWLHRAWAQNGPSLETSFCARVWTVENPPLELLRPPRCEMGPLLIKEENVEDPNATIKDSLPPLRKIH